MARKTRKTAKTTEQRAAEVAALRDRLEEFTEDMDEGQLAMITALHDGYSERNATLIAMQDPEATDVSGFKAWQDRGRAVMARDRWPAGTDSIKILAPAGQRDAQAADAQAGTPEVKARRFFRIATVFDVRLTEPLADAKARWEAAAAERELANA